MIKLTKIDKIEESEYTGDVYNLELSSNDPASDRDDLYWVEEESRIITHNCFPKDLRAIISLAEDLGIQPLVTSAVWAKNLEVRESEDRDWERMIGRAVTKEGGK